MARQPDIKITTDDLSEIVYSNLRIGDTPLRELKPDKGNGPPAGLLYIDTGGKKFSEIKPWDFDLIAYHYRIVDYNFDKNDFTHDWVEKASERPWRIRVDWPAELETGKLVRVLVLPFKKWRDTLDCAQLPEYRYGYELPHLLVSERLTLQDAARLENMLPAIVRIMSYSYLGEQANHFAISFLMFIHLFELEGTAERYGFSPVLSRRSFDNCSLPREKLEKFKSMSEDEKVQLELSLNLPSFKMEHIIRSWDTFGQRMAAGFADSPRYTKGILDRSVIPPVTLPYEKIRQRMEARGGKFEPPDVRVPYQDAKLIKSLTGFLQRLGTEHDLAVNHLTNAFNDARAALMQNRSVFKRYGQYWITAFAGVIKSFRDRKGMQYIHFLLAHPSDPDKPVEYHVLDLIGLVEGRSYDAVSNALSLFTKEGLSMIGLSVIDLKQPEKLVSRRTTQAVRRRRDDIIDKLAANRFSDPYERIDLERDLEDLKRYMSAAVGLWGRDRTDSKAVKNARASVAKVIKAAITEIGKENKPLSVHFHNSIHTGKHLHYSPERPIVWQL